MNPDLRQTPKLHFVEKERFLYKWQTGVGGGTVASENSICLQNQKIRLGFVTLLHRWIPARWSFCGSQHLEFLVGTAYAIFADHSAKPARTPNRMDGLVQEPEPPGRSEIGRSPASGRKADFLYPLAPGKHQHERVGSFLPRRKLSPDSKPYQMALVALTVSSKG